jgi:hypothetical protein
MLKQKMTEEANSESAEQASETFGFEKFDDDSGLIIKSHRERKIPNGVEILAEVENTGETTWSSVSIEVELFDDQDRFVDECTTYLSGNMAPQRVENAKIKCGGCENNPLPEYARYTIRVVDAHTF